MTASVYDAVVVGAGSVGMPTAMYLAEKGLKVLCIDQFASAGQGSNKCALGGIRATHSAPAKIKLCLDSLEVFSHWEERHGYNIEWFRGGYAFVAYREHEEKLLKDLLVLQKRAGLNIDWHGREDFLEIGELMCLDALERRESCGGHFREEWQTPDGEALRDDENFAHVAAWEYTGEGSAPKRHTEPLQFEYVHLATRSYK